MAIFCLILVVGFSYVACEADQATSNDLLLQRVLQENQELRTRLEHLENWKTAVTSDIDGIRQNLGMCLLNFAVPKHCIKKINSPFIPWFHLSAK